MFLIRFTKFFKVELSTLDMDSKRVILNKRGNEIVMPEIVLIVLSILFFGAMLVFVTKAANSSLFYEEVYAKKIALTLESASPGTTLEFDISKIYQIAKQNKFDGFRDNFFYFNEQDQSVLIKLSSSGGYLYKVMSNVSIAPPTVNLDEKNKQYSLILFVQEP